MKHTREQIIQSVTDELTQKGLFCDRGCRASGISGVYGRDPSDTIFTPWEGTCIGETARSYKGKPIVTIEGEKDLPVYELSPEVIDNPPDDCPRGFSQLKKDRIAYFEEINHEIVDKATQEGRYCDRACGVTVVNHNSLFGTSNVTRGVCIGLANSAPYGFRPATSLYLDRTTYADLDTTNIDNPPEDCPHDFASKKIIRNRRLYSLRK